MPYCGHCGTAYGTGAESCASCGADLTAGSDPDGSAAKSPTVSIPTIERSDLALNLSPVEPTKPEGLQMALRGGIIVGLSSLVLLIALAVVLTNEPVAVERYNEWAMSTGVNHPALSLVVLLAYLVCSIGLLTLRRFWVTPFLFVYVLMWLLAFGDGYSLASPPLVVFVESAFEAANGWVVAILLLTDVFGAEQKTAA